MSAALWNALYPEGTKVAAYPDTLDDEPLITVTRSRAWTLGHGEPCVLVEGVSGGVVLGHVHPLDREGPIPARVQRRWDEGGRTPAGARYVGGGTRWSGPYKLGETLVRYPGIHGAEWELEGRLSKTVGEQHHFRHPDDRITWHQVEYATAEQVVALYRAWLAERPELAAAARTELAGRDLTCWCPPRVPCPTDVLLEVSNT